MCILIYKLRYGGGPPLKRTVISVGSRKRLEVEVFPRRHIVVYGRTKQEALLFSKAHTIGYIKAKVSMFL